MAARTIRFLTSLLVLAALTVSASAQPWDVYKEGVPDVDKPNPADNSCWMAAAANVLGAGGWGDAGTIYSSMLNHFVDGNDDPLAGWSSVAINWWLMEHGRNPDSDQYVSDPGVAPYKDVTIITERLDQFAYDFLLDELDRCQYVNVSFEVPGQSVGHEMTLVGGNYAGNPFGQPDGEVSVWHDNQGDLSPPAGDDDMYANVWMSGTWWNIDYPQTPTDPNDDWEAIGATILCPGPVKPDDAVENFDVAWYMDMDPAGTLFPRFRQAGTNNGAYANDQGGTDAYWESDTVLVVPNEQMPEPWYKEIWLQIDYIDRDNQDPDIQVDVGGTLYDPTTITWSGDFGQVLLYWKLDEVDGQPPWERIVFPDDSYSTLYDISTGQGGDVKDWNLATICVPEPATLAILALGGALAVRRRRQT